MRRLGLGDLLLPIVIFVLPLAPVPARLLHPGPWAGFLTALLTLATQPALGIGEMVGRGGPDRLSALAIYAGVLGPQLVAILEFGYREPLFPAAVSAATIGGVALVTAGMALRVWSIRMLGRFFTATVRVQAGQAIVSDGPYRVVRHPSYTGTLVVASGMTLALGSPIGAALVVLLTLPAYLYRIAVEERALLAELGQAYRDYRERTWRLVPFVY